MRSKSAFLLGCFGLLFVAGCGEQTKGNANPTVTPLRGHWSSLLDNLHFNDIQVEGTAITYYGPFVGSDIGLNGEVTIQREVYQGSFSIEDRVEIDRPNGKWTEGNLKILVQRSSCAGLKGVAKDVKQPFALHWTGEGDTLKENFFWGAPAQPGAIQFERYKEEETKNAGGRAARAKVKEVQIGCFVDGKFVPNAKVGPLP